MRFNLVTNLSNGCGLQQDYVLLKAELERRGHTVHGIHFRHPTPRAADVNIFLEIAALPLMTCAAQNWMVPNPEWFFAPWCDYPWDLILAKTRDCEQIFRPLVGDRCVYLGWRARDLYDASIPRQRAVLHVAGKSSFKNTRAVIEGCQQAHIPLLVVSDRSWAGTPWHHRVSDMELKYLMNSHWFHCLPSMYEGWGMALHEALGCGQVVITTNAPPMNELSPVVLVPSHSTRPHHLGTLHTVTVTAVQHALQEVWEWPTPRLEQWQQEGRAQFLADDHAFQDRLSTILSQRKAA